MNLRPHHASEAALEEQEIGLLLLRIRRAELSPIYMVGIDTKKLSDKGAGGRTDRTGLRPEPTRRESWLMYDNELRMLRHPILLLCLDMSC